MEKFVTTSTEPKTDGKWNINEMYGSEFQVYELIHTLETIDKFKRIYPNLTVIESFESIVRNEVCKIMGGSINED